MSFEVILIESTMTWFKKNSLQMKTLTHVNFGLFGIDLHS